MESANAHPAPVPLPTRRPRLDIGCLRPAEPQPMTSVALAVRRVADARYVYCAAGSDDVEWVGRVSSPSTHVAVLDALVDIRRRAAGHPRLRFAVQLSAGSPLWRSKIEIETLLPGVLLDFAAPADAPLFHKAHTRINAEVAPAPPSARDFEPVTVATDGSVRGAITGWGWLATDGRYGLRAFTHSRKVIGSNPVLVAELRAIDDAVRAIRHAPLTILTDSRLAVTMVRKWAAGITVLPDGYTTDRGNGPAGLVQAQRRIQTHRDRIDIVWQPGHRGHLLNEGADALARLASRRLTPGNDLTNDEYHRRAQGLADGFADAFRAEHVGESRAS
ncbi:RNase H family protein [Gordonia sp. VNQ95]|uniref:ribonuclease HI n=1 Tax=Gordonia sp. VNQ95 TaxID=3156619 RepID=UPI0032B5BBEF